MMKLKSKGFSKVIRKLEHLETGLDTGLKRAMERLAELGVEVAKSSFDRAIYDGTNDVVVEKAHWVSENKIEIVARGKVVAFIEFGTGVGHTEHELSASLGLKHGSYGKGQGANPPWVYKGEKGNGTATPVTRTNKSTGQKTIREGVWWSEGNPPARGMYLAGEEIKNNILKIVKEEVMR